MEQAIAKFNEGGPVITYTIVLLLIVIVALFIKVIITKNEYSKTISLISSIAWFAVAWGFLGRTFGLIIAFDNVSAHGELTVALLAEGLKMALLGPLLGIFVFIIGRVEMIILIIIQRKEAGIGE
ncbi:MAG: hypothetical protein A2X13_03230 [Bacteroidetes bacterium GWC2_33_15]|nr:MAG: hypothetical protein A2X10_09765 [Bacteroidetes bacterium GWA2_33_15]OFX49557.1 MAG: hypothetical protein A2X13_03230 [Bacteroidetes bacterium GWC2_33_15]OFX63605.1 MAG: hypothetical protein A2X15_00995 [Bacteroidetes bacterium GWB2_32_14]OFX68818.1 MAG: hypothetical protein A2X14_12990 [Bacteroidetes bacterium GWD2_33_33]HAN17588.1 biopolymer transporter ExbD [Bacteroidales bacterium]